jgi:CHAT domain-containing protein/tetratricopeptide (TPR) repeat protein
LQQIFRQGATMKAWWWVTLLVVATASLAAIGDELKSPADALTECYALVAAEDYPGAESCAKNHPDALPSARLRVRIEALQWNGESKPDLVAELREQSAYEPADAGVHAQLEFTAAMLSAQPQQALGLALAERDRAEKEQDDLARDEAMSAIADAHLALHHNDAGPAALNAAAAAWHARTDTHAHWHEIMLQIRSGALQQRLGRYAEAAKFYQQAADLSAATFGADSAARITADLQRSHQYEDLGRYREELDLRQELLQRALRGPGEKSGLTADIEASVGSVLGTLGDYAAARPHYENAERILAQLPDAQWRTRAVILNNFANSLQESGDLKAALERQKTVLQISAEHPGTERMRAVVLANMGNTEFSMSRMDAAQAHFHEAQALREKVDGATSPGVAYAVEGLGSVALARQQFADAEAYFKHVLVLRGPAYSAQHPLLDRSRFAIALARWGQGDLDGAFEQAVKIARSEQGVLAHLATEFVERQSVSYRDQLVPATALVVTLAMQRGDAKSLATAWELTMRERGLISRNEARRIAAARAASDPALQSAWLDWRKANTAYAEAWAGQGIDGATLDTLRGNAEKTELALWDRLGTGGEAATDIPSVEQLAAALPPKAQLLAMTEGLEPNPAQVFRTDNGFNIDWYAFDLSAGGSPHLRRLGRASALSADARAWYSALRDPNGDRKELRRRGNVVRQELLETAQVSTQPHDVYVVPQGDLFRVNLAALPDGDGYLVERGVNMHTLVHENDLLIPASHADVGKILLAGAPDFPAAKAGIARRQVCIGAPVQGFTRLQSAEHELDDLHQVFGDAAASMTDLRGAEATRERVMRALPEARVVHLATHGFSLDDTCAEAPTRAITLESAGAKPAMSMANASLSGLAFSGAKLGGGGTAVGVLSAADLVSLDLSHVDWVALSACDSGLGPIGRGEGVFGMRRALRLAGARTVVMSLWEVDDAATAQLMGALYKARFTDHKAVPEAMGDAMRGALAQRRRAGESDHPFYWAAFVSEGGWH